MGNIKVGRYTQESSESHGFAGWIEPDDQSWIVFVKNDHTVEAYLDRDPRSGAIRD